MNEVIQQRDFSLENSQKQYNTNQNMQLKISQQVLQTLNTLQGSLNNYNSKCSEVIKGVTEELTRNVNTHKAKHDSTLKSLLNITTNLLMNQMNELVRSISTSLEIFQSDSTSHYRKDLNEIYQSHQQFLKNLQNDIKSCLDSIGSSILTSINEISQNCTTNLNSMNVLIENQQSGSSKLIKEQDLEIKKLKNDLINERRISNQFNQQLAEMKRYFQDHVSRTRSEFHDELNKCIDNLKDKQSKLDQDIWQKTASIFNETDIVVNKIHSDSIASLAHNAENTLKTVSQNNESFTNDLISLSRGMNMDISSKLRSLPINEFLNKISQTICETCGDDNTIASNPVLTSIKKFQNIICSDIALTNEKIMSLIDEIQSQIETISNENNINLIAINENFNSLCNFILTDYDENIMQISKTQDEVLSEHCEKLQSLKILGMDIFTAHSIEKPLHEHTRPEASVIKALPLLDYPKQFQIYRDAENKSKDDTSNSRTCIPNLSTNENFPLSQFSPKTPVPVPDQPLPKVLIPKSINSAKSNRSKTLPNTEGTGRESQNNLKRRFTTEPILKGEETENNDILQNKKLHQ